jgi:ribosomal protein L17
MTNAQFDAWAESLGLEFFQPHELRFLGGSHYLPKGKASGKNTLPPKAMLANMVCSLIKEKRITTTLPKARAARSIAEKMVTLGKTGTLHCRRLAVSRLHDKDSVKELFGTIAPALGGRAVPRPRSSKPPPPRPCASCPPTPREAVQPSPPTAPASRPALDSARQAPRPRSWSGTHRSRSSATSPAPCSRNTG